MIDASAGGVSSSALVSPSSAPWTRTRRLTELIRRRSWREARRLLRENGVTYNVYGDPQERGGDLAIARQRVVIAGRGAGRRRRAADATRASGPTTPSERVVWVCRSMVDGPGGTTRPASLGGNGSWRRRREAAVTSHARRHLTSTSRWMRSIARARPVAGSMSTWTALK